MKAIVRYVQLTFRLFVRQWSARDLLVGVLVVPPLMFLDDEGFPARDAAMAVEQVVLSLVAVVGYACGRLLRGRSVTPDRTSGGFGFPLPIAARARWMSGLFASSVVGLVACGTVEAIGLTVLGTWSLENFFRPVGIVMLALLPWAGAAFLGREGPAGPVQARILGVGVLWTAALRWLNPDVLVLSLWSALLLLGEFLVASRLEHAQPLPRPGSLRRGLAWIGKRWPPLPALGAAPLSPFRAWERVLMQMFVQRSLPAAVIIVCVWGLMGAYWQNPGDHVQAEALDMANTMVVICAGVGVGSAVRAAAPGWLAPAALLPVPARSLWWGTLLATLPLSILMIGVFIGSAVVAALLAGEPLDPTLYQAFLASAPILVAVVLLLRATWHLGFLLATPKRALSIVCVLLGSAGFLASSIWHPSFVLSSFALAASIGVLGLLAPQRYRAPA
jgi:hypothetical protein